MTEQRKISTTNGTKVPPHRTLMSFREFVEAQQAGRPPATHSAGTATTAHRSKRANTILEAVRESVARKSDARKSAAPVRFKIEPRRYRP